MSVRIPDYFQVTDKNMNVKVNTNMQDMQLKAQNGIRVGDVQNEAHTAYVMAVANENQKKYL